MNERDARRTGGDDLVTFEANPPGTPPPAEEIYEPPANPRFTPSPTPVARSVKPPEPRDVFPDIPRPSDLRRHAEEPKPSSGRRFVVIAAILGMFAIGCTGIAAIGLGVAWLQFQPVAEPVPVEVVPAEPELPAEVGGIPLEKGLRRGPVPVPVRPDTP